MKRRICPHCGHTWLTPRQIQVLMFIRGYLVNRLGGPSLNEICKHFDWVSRNAAYSFLRQLQRAGVVEVEPFKIRGIKVTKRGWEV